MTTQAIITDVQVFWDDQDPNNEGWWCRYYIDGTEHGFELDGSKDRDKLELAKEVQDFLGQVAGKVFDPTTEQVKLHFKGNLDYRWS